MIEPDNPLTTDVIDVDTLQLCLISVAVKVQSDKVYTDTTTDPGTTNKIDRHTLQYNFPIRYRVLDPEGIVLFEQSDTVAWNS